MLEGLSRIVDRCVGEGQLVVAMLAADGSTAMSAIDVRGSLHGDEAQVAEAVARHLRVTLPEFDRKYRYLWLIKAVGTWQEAPQWTPKIFRIAELL